MTTNDEPTSTNLIFVRHGDYVGDATDPEEPEERLTAKGRRQMETVAESLAGLEFDAVFCSDMPRSVESADIVHAQLPDLPEASVDDLLRERLFPVAERFRNESVQRTLAEREKPDDELFGIIDAIWSTYFRVGRETRRELFIVHGNLIRTLCMRALGLGLDEWMTLPVCHNGSMTEFLLWGERETLIAYNDRHRLPEELRTG